jgi:nitrogenase molybdenum-iron protein alpha/beta subunit
MPSIKYLLETGLNPEVILTPGVFRLGSYSEMSETEEELEKVVQGYDNVIYFGSSDRYPPCTVVNLGLISRFPRYGFRGIKNIAKLIETALEDTLRPRSKLFKQMIYG